MQTSYILTKKNDVEHYYKTQYGPPFKLFKLTEPAVERKNIIIISMGIVTT